MVTYKLITNKAIIEKKHRLEEDYYTGAIAVSFTLCIIDRKCAFDNIKIFNEVETILLNKLAKYKCGSLVHLFMFDHAHLVLQGLEDDSSLLNVLKGFKQKTGYIFSQQRLGFKWQKDYYDHIIRNENDIKNHVLYVLNNPVRKGIVKFWNEYPFKGSTIFNLDELE